MIIAWQLAFSQFCLSLGDLAFFAVLNFPFSLDPALKYVCLVCDVIIFAFFTDFPDKFLWGRGQFLALELFSTFLHLCKPGPRYGANR